MENFYLLVFSILFTAIVGIIGYFLKSVHSEVKQLIKELTAYTSKLKELIVGIQTQIDKSIEADIKEMKQDVKQLQAKAHSNERNINRILGN